MDPLDHATDVFVKANVGRDLLGQTIRKRRRAYEAALERRDAATVTERAARVRWLNKVLPKGGMLMPSDSHFVFTEARSTFVDGYFIATTILASAFAEHWLAGVLSSKGFEKEAARGLSACIQCARKNGLWPEFVLDRLDRLRRVRNPFVHLKEFSHPHNLTQRSWLAKRDPGEVVEEDARFALETIFALVQIAPG